MAVAQISDSTLSKHISTAALIFVLAGVSLATYGGSFIVIDELYSRRLWPWITNLNLSGDWDMELTNLADGSTRTGNVHIVHTPKGLMLSCVNFRPGTDVPYSTWSTMLADFVDEATLVFLYQVESTVDWKPFKRGVMRLLVSSEHSDIMTGNFFDNAPSDDRGPVVFRRRQLPTP